MEASDIVLESVLERIQTVEDEITRLLGKEFACLAAQTTLESLKNVLGKMRATVGDFAEDARRNGTATDDLDIELSGLTSPVVFFHEALQFLDHTDSSRVPFELLPAFETLARELTGAPVSLVLKPSQSFNYEILDFESHLRRCGQDGEVLANSARGVHVALFPSAEAGSALIHTILFHEIGHSCFSKFVNADDANASFAEVAKRIVPSRSSEEIITTECLAALSSWLGELFCDCLALRLVGPAYVCAFRWYTSPVAPLDDANATHPPPALRLEIMGHYLDRLRTANPAVAELCGLYGKHAEPSRADDADGATPSPEKPGSMVRSALRDEVFRTQLFAEFDRIPTPFSRATITTDIARAAKEIRAFVPPGASSSSYAASIADMLAVTFNACWLFRIDSMKPWNQEKPHGLGWDKPRCVRILNQLCLASLEGGELLFRFRGNVANDSNRQADSRTT